jgi:hypothetical protein
LALAGESSLQSAPGRSSAGNALLCASEREDESRSLFLFETHLVSLVSLAPVLCVVYFVELG